MLLRFPLTKILFPLTALGVFATAAAGCGGCNDASLVCDEAGRNCQICDAFGCHPAEGNSGGGQPAGSTTGVGGSDGGHGGDGGDGGNGATGGSGGSGGATGGGGSGGHPPVCNPAVETCGCGPTGECPSGLDCVDGLCIDGCTFSYECGPESVCANGKCVDKCGPKETCPTPGYKCDKGICVPDSANPECDVEHPCAGGDVCVEGICASPCATNEDCGEGEICNGVTGTCIDDPSPQQGCGGTTQCTGPGQVCGDDGYCHYPCTTATECQLHSVFYTVCEDEICKTDEEANPECTLEDPCPDGKDCISNECI